MFKHPKLLLLILIAQCLPVCNAQDVNILKEYIHDELIKRHAIVKEDLDATQPVEELSSIEKFKAQLVKVLPKPVISNLSDRDSASASFNALYKNNDTANDFKEEIIDVTSLNKLHLFNCETSLLESIFGTTLFTHAGKATALYQLVNPTTDILLLTNRQNIVQLLIKDSQAQSLNTFFKNMANHQKGIWSFWHTQPLINKDFEKTIYFNLPGLKKFNTSTGILEADRCVTTALTILSDISTIFLPITVLKFGTGITFKQAFLVYINQMKNIASNVGDPKIKFALTYLTVLSPILSSVGIYQQSVLFKNNALVLDSIHKALIDFSSTVTQLGKINTIIQSNLELINAFPELTHIVDLFKPSHHSLQFNKLMKMLRTNTFNGAPSFFSIYGRIKAAYKLMLEVKDEFLPALRAAAQLETYSALAQIYADHRDKNAQYCFVDYVQDGPYISGTQFWNPLILSDNAIVNDIQLGKTSAHNVILTGPNTAGKTTVIKGLGQAILLAQTFGIAPAHSFIVSPFSKINCFMEINDDISSGTSLFKAEVKRAKQLVEQMKELKSNEYMFTLMDEVFTSTSPKEGEHAALLFIKQFGNFSNSAHILVTHYPLLTTLADKNAAFANMHVEVIRNQNDSLTRTFKLKDGPSFMNIALDILQDEGVLTN